MKLDYYWRDYTGEIPDDAVPGGTDKRKERTYIGQACVLGQGLLPARIYKGEKTVAASKQSAYTSSKAVKILCSQQPEKFVWFPTTSNSLHMDVVGKHMVVGGYENGKTVEIGRGTYQEEVIVGKVCSYRENGSALYFPHGNKECSVDRYEVLVYDDDA